MTTPQMKKMAENIFDKYWRKIQYEEIKNGDAVEGMKEQEFILENKQQIIDLICWELANIRNWKTVKDVKLVKEFGKYRVDIEEIEKSK